MEPHLFFKLIQNKPNWFAASMAVIFLVPLIFVWIWQEVFRGAPWLLPYLITFLASAVFSIIFYLTAVIHDRTILEKIIASARQSDLSTDELLSFVEDAGGFKLDSNLLWGPFLLKIVRSKIEDARHFFKDLKNEQITIDHEEFDYLLDLTELSKKSVRATSLVTVDTKFWVTSKGKKYSRLLCDAVDRKCSVQRVFVGNSEQLDTIKDVALDQHRSGMEVRIYKTADGIAHVSDFILFDDQMMYKVSCIPGTAVIESTEIFGPTSEQLHHQKRVFDDVWEQSIPLVEYWDPLATEEEEIRP